MKPGLAKAIVSACVAVWGLAAIVGGITSESDMAIQRLGAFQCPDDTVPGHTTYQQTVRDSDGFTSQDTVWVLQCKDASGAVVKENPEYMWPWIGLFVGAAMVLTLPVLVGLLIALLVGRAKSSRPNPGVGLS
jgi:hypothetical protein